MPDLSELLFNAVGPERTHAGVTTYTRYVPPDDSKVFPPSFPTDGRSEEPPYLFEKRRVDGEPCDVVVLDQVPSQANRVETALLDARDAGRIQLPLFELTTTASDGIPVRLTSLQFPHRFADAYLRDSQIDGVKFDNTEIGRRLRSTTATDVRPLFEYSPESLVFGGWDSHRKGRGVKIPRFYSATVFGLEPEKGERASGRMDPLNLSGAVKHTSQGGWEFTPTGEKKQGERLSELGHGNIAPSPAHGGVAISEARRSGWLSLSGLANLRFGDASDEAARLARATLLALALAGDRLAFDAPSLWLRSGCDLVRTHQQLTLEGGAESEPMDVSAEQAIACFHELRERTARAGITMSTDTVPLAPQPGLAQAIDYSLTRAEYGEAE
ncbi:CRISPR-associated Csx4 family protein [Haloactinospora alba]|uniref:CRISPR-associated Csx4 family protein n=1 Tax=Haloactinospora alba TaxID=405555 RepID=A0A543NFE8_9ACTN|nr:type I-U CRISPR-associated RAMP protein Csb1/Cas7u [Haloactinospora alba]TQN30554.1 CRISPR-associated Csx4 family protein [Haloactinospora alba]